MARTTLWPTAAFAILVIAVSFVADGFLDDFAVIKNSAGISRDAWAFILGNLAAVLIFQIVIVATLHSFLRAMHRRARWDHLVFVILVVWGSMTWAFATFGLAYGDLYAGEGSWQLTFYLTLYSIPLIPVAFIVMVVREVLTSRRSTTM